MRMLGCRDGPPPRQHVTLPTGVAETVFDEDPEAEEAAVALADDPFLGQDTPSRSAPDAKTTSLQDSLEGAKADCLFAASVHTSYMKYCSRCRSVPVKMESLDLSAAAAHAHHTMSDVFSNHKGTFQNRMIPCCCCMAFLFAAAAD